VLPLRAHAQETFGIDADADAHKARRGRRREMRDADPGGRAGDVVAGIEEEGLANEAVGGEREEPLVQRLASLEGLEAPEDGRVDARQLRLLDAVDEMDDAARDIAISGQA
jgi:hypothetical protein